ncbi:hypothetical protein JCM6882_006178 [Rhodosporidiobolus microsporus]
MRAYLTSLLSLVCLRTRLHRALAVMQSVNLSQRAQFTPSIAIGAGKNAPVQPEKRILSSVTGLLSDLVEPLGLDPVTETLETDVTLTLLNDAGLVKLVLTGHGLLEGKKLTVPIAAEAEVADKGFDELLPKPLNELVEELTGVVSEVL